MKIVGNVSSHGHDHDGVPKENGNVSTAYQHLGSHDHEKGNYEIIDLDRSPSLSCTNTKPTNLAKIWNFKRKLMFDSQVPNIVVNNQVPWDGWNHLDFLYAIDIDQYQNDDLLAVLAMYPIE